MAELKPKLQLSNTYQLDLQQTARLLEWLGRMNMRRWKRSLAVRDLGLAERMHAPISSPPVAKDIIHKSNPLLAPHGRVLERADP